MTLQVAELGRILSVWAHPDDETYLAGGLMAAASDQGLPVVCVSATAGELGTDDPETWPPERLGPLRRQEAAAAMRVLGVADHRWLGRPDGGLAQVDAEAAVGQVGELLDEVAPDTVLTFAADGMTFHPDHVAVHRWVTEAWERHRTRTGRRCRLLYAALEAEHHRQFAGRLEEWGVYMTDERPVAWQAADLTVHLVLDEALLDRKLAALAAMPSQTASATALLSAQDYRELNRVEAFVRA
jgi:LmbE family N-acetylglucosaminyl deacetylase